MDAMGKTVIFTDIKGLTAQEISEIYDSRNRIETDIKWLKDKLLIPLKPMFVRKDVNIRAHVFLCVMGLLLYKYLQYVIADDGLSVKKLAENLDEMRLGLIYEGKDNMAQRKNVKFVIEDMSKDTSKIFSSLKLGEYIPN